MNRENLLEMTGGGGNARRLGGKDSEGNKAGGGGRGAMRDPNSVVRAADKSQREGNEKCATKKVGA